MFARTNLVSFILCTVSLVVGSPGARSAATRPVVQVSPPTFDVGSTFASDAYGLGPSEEYWHLNYTLHWTISAPAGVCRQQVIRDNYDTQTGGDVPDRTVGNAARSFSTELDQLTYFRGGERLRVVVTDCRGVRAQSKWVTVPVVPRDDKDAKITLSGVWKVDTCTCAAYGTTRYTRTRGASFSFRSDPAPDATGIDVGLVMARGPDQGAAEVYVDGKLWTTIRTYSKVRVSSGVAYQIPLRDARRHAITVVNSASAGHPRIDIDAILNGGD